MNWFTSSKALSGNGLAIARILFGLLLIVHGSQMFYGSEMASYEPWLKDLGVPLPLFSAYLGKILELAGGVCLVLGVVTRLACLLLMGTFLFITIVMGDGKVFTDGQHPFLFFLISMIFLFTGAGPWTLSDFLKKH